MDFVSTLQEELVRAGVLPEDYDFSPFRVAAPRIGCTTRILMP